MKRLSAIAVSLLLVAPNVDAAPKKPTKAPAKKPVNKPKPKPKPAPTPRPADPILPATPYKPALPKPTPDKPNPTPEPVAEPVVAKGPKTWALLVGIGQYSNLNISSLRFPAKDAEGIRDALVDPKLGGLSPKQVLLLANEDATRSKITGAVDSFLRPNVKSGDKVVVFLAGHGVAKGAGIESKSYLLPTDVKGVTTEALESSAVSLTDLSADLATLPASQLVVFVDACREDPTPGRGLKGNSLSDVLARSIAVVPKDESAQSATFFACSIGQRAFEDTSYGHGVFTNWIIKGVREGAVAEQPDGDVDMGRLSSYVTEKVGQWSRNVSASGSMEVTQTPELIGYGVKRPVILLNDKRNLSVASFKPTAPKLAVAASPEIAQITINGTRAGTGVAERSVPSEGNYSVVVSAPGYAPITQNVTALDGYEHQVIVQLTPLGAGGAPVSAGNGQASDFYRRALDAQERQQYEIAEQNLKAAIAADPKFGAAYEALLDQHRLQNRNLDGVADALGLLAIAPKNANSLSIVSRAYSQFATKDAGEDNAASSFKGVGDYGKPKNPKDAVKLAVQSAKAAVAADANLPAANLAQGYALAALDVKGDNKQKALDAFGKAAFLDASDAANHLGLGYGIRYYALLSKKEDKKASELSRAVAALNEAVRLRPNYYEAHRELAFCYIALNQPEAALRECRLARSNRGGAGDVNEIASVELAMSGLHQQVAMTSSGDKKKANEDASQGYLDEAKETAPNADLKIALSILGTAGVSTSLSSYLPASLRPLMDIRGTVEGEIRNRIPGIGGFRFP